MSNITIDHVGFTFAGLHSIRSLGLYRVSSSNRYDENFGASQKDTTVEIAGADGVAYFSTNITSKQWTINVAFDSMTEVQMRLLKKTWTAKTVGELVFDEEPYKAWDAKLNAAPQFKYLSFVENGTRIYKGEATLSFIAYYPYAHTPLKLYNASGELTTLDGRISSNYNASYYTNLAQWLPSSSIQTSILNGTKYRNCGDIDSPVKFTVPLSGTYTAVKIAIGTDEIIINISSSAGYTSLTLDTRIGVAIAHTATADIPVRVTSGNPMLKLPANVLGTQMTVARMNGQSATYITNDCTIEYNYWYI